MHTNYKTDEQPKGARVLSTNEAAECVGLSPSTLEKLRVRGTGPAYLKLGHSVRYRLADLERWLTDQLVTSTSDRRHEVRGSRPPE